MIKKLCLFLALFQTVIFLHATQITVLNTTDMHGHIDDQYSGILQIAYLAGQQKKLFPVDATLLIDCGDTIQGTSVNMLTKGSLMIKCMNYLNYDVWVPGNHEFDYPLAIVKKRIIEFSGVTLAANLESNYLSGTYRPWQLIVKNNIKIAVIGLTSPNMDNSIFINDKKFRTTSFFSALRKIMPEIHNAKPDIIILVQHCGKYGKDFSTYKLVAEYPEIDLILGGHSHQKNPGEKIGSGTWFFQSVKHCLGIGRVIIEYDQKLKKIIKIESKIIPVKKETPVDKKLLELIAPELERIKKLEKQKIAEIDFRNTGKLDSSLIEKKIIGSMILKKSGADIAILNAYPSNYRLSGKVAITLKRIFYWYRYNNTICTLTLDKPAYMKIIAEQKKLIKRNYQPIISYADKNLFKKKHKFIVAFSNYAITGAGGKFPLLAKLAKDKKYMFKNIGILIRYALIDYLKGKSFIISNMKDGQISIEQKTESVFQ